MANNGPVLIKVQPAPVIHMTAGPPPVIHMRAGPVGSQGPPGPPGADALWVSMTQTEYDALPVKDPNTLYVIIGP